MLLPRTTTEVEEIGKQAVEGDSNVDLLVTQLQAYESCFTLRKSWSEKLEWIYMEIC
jgi:hypothetical protein